MPHPSEKSKYEFILESSPVNATPRDDFELHTLTCERDFLRSLWSLKSFYHFSGLRPRLVIHNDGSLSESSVSSLKSHFVGCTMLAPPDEKVMKALTLYPMCRFFRDKKLALSRMLFDYMICAEADYIVGMDSDILWYSNAPTLASLIKSRTPFYLSGGEAYVRNRQFMEQHCGLVPAPNCNVGLIGYPRKRFLDLEYIEAAMDKLVNVPPELIEQSLGYFEPRNRNFEAGDSVNSICWWVMEQTVYALLFQRVPDSVGLNSYPYHGEAHQFGGSEITECTATVHFCGDGTNNRFFPVGVEHLVQNNGFLDSLRSQTQDVEDTGLVSSLPSGKVFVIGYPRTGTTTLHWCLEILGYKAKHFIPDIHPNLDSELFNEFTAFSDLPFPMMYKELDEYFPGSKFILTIRETSSWLDSCEYLFSCNKNWTEEIHQMNEAAYGTRTFEPGKIRRRYDIHNREVLEYFKDRSDLAVLDLTGGGQWEVLCSFLGKEVPSVPFPHLNRRGVWYW